ncbi:ATP-binding cassette domain-containing protein, partial [Streptomyces sp. NPDC058572]|uniref:ATP-binding cassette domain-containing protein n=1 Tax=Streptomyces sp. NPDC058572 TaxID=3346546 RepID=UPI003669968E
MVHVPNAPLLALRGISKRFGAVWALTDVELEIHAGEVVALVGDNGAGKSTLVKVITGVAPADEGVIKWDGSPVRISRPRGGGARRGRVGGGAPRAGGGSGAASR